MDEFSTFAWFTTSHMIKEVFSLNKKVNVWTVDDSVKIDKLVNLGIDGIITNYPNFISRK